jgi:G3E family GTPase
VSDKVPAHVLTGFLGSGKTTLLRHVLTSPGFSDCAVLINEFGEIGLDHHLVADLRGDVVLMSSGCVCCTIRGDLAQSMRDLYARRERGKIGFSRLVVETTGLADPTPILSTVMYEPQLRYHFRLGHVIATVDAVNGAAQLDRQPESVKQAALADRIVLTKTDIAVPEQVQALERRIGRLNPSARRWRSANTPPPAELLLGESLSPNPLPEGERFAPAFLQREGGGEGHDHSRHEAGIHSFTLTFDADVDWGVFAVWFTLLLRAHGADVLRVKGLLRVAGAAGPVLVNAVQHVVHPPQHLEAWPAEWRESRLVFIVRDLARSDIEGSFAAFQSLLRERERP